MAVEKGRTDNEKDFATKDFVNQQVADGLSDRDTVARAMISVLENEKQFDEPFSKALVNAVKNNQELRNQIADAVLWRLAGKIGGAIVALVAFTTAVVDIVLRVVK